MTMPQDLVPISVPRPLKQTPQYVVPALFAAAGKKAAHRFMEFFAANIRNPHTRAAYAQAIRR